MIADLSEEKKKRKMSTLEYQNKMVNQQWTRVDDPRWTSTMPTSKNDTETNQNENPHDNHHRSDPLIDSSSATRNANNEADRIRLHQQWVREDAFMPQDPTPNETDYNII